MQRLLVFFQQRRPRLPLVVDDLRNDFADLVQDRGFTLAQRHLIGNLVEVAEGAAPFAVQAANGEIDRSLEWQEGRLVRNVWRDPDGVLRDKPIHFDSNAQWPCTGDGVRSPK